MEFICPYCRTELHEQEWKSEFSISKHYKTTDCKKCGKRISVPVNFHGSGHDNWREEKNLSQINTKEKLENLEKTKAMNKTKKNRHKIESLEKIVA